MMMTTFCYTFQHHTVRARHDHYRAEKVEKKTSVDQYELWFSSALQSAAIRAGNRRTNDCSYFLRLLMFG